MPTVAGRDMEAMDIEDMDIEGRGSSSARRRRPLGAYGRPYWEPYPYPPVVMAPPPRSMSNPAPLPPQYWYYCDAAQAYYPYVQECPGEWPDRCCRHPQDRRG